MLIICIPKTNTSRNLDVQISLQLKSSSYSVWTNLIERKHGSNKRPVNWNNGNDDKNKFMMEIQNWMKRKAMVILSQPCLKYDSHLKEIEWLKN